MITEYVASAAVRQPLLHAYWAIADPSSCATLPKLKASLPFAPKRFGPIWSVPMQDATVKTPRSIAAWTTGAASSTSQVVKMTFAFCPSRRSAHALAMSALFPCVSQVRSRIGWPLTPPFALSWLIRNFAAARAGLSNGAMLPLLSYAQPITSCFLACAAPCPAVAATALPIRASASSAVAAIAHLPRAFSMYCLPLEVVIGLDGTGRYRVNRILNSGLPGTFEGVLTCACKLLRRHVPV